MKSKKEMPRIPCWFQNIKLKRQILLKWLCTLLLVANMALVIKCIKMKNSFKKREKVLWIMHKVLPVVDNPLCFGQSFYSEKLMLFNEFMLGG